MRTGAGAVLAATALLALGLPAHALTIGCTTSASGIAFGLYNPASAAPTAVTGSIIVTCTGTGSGSQAITVAVSLSSGLAGSFAPRKMLSGANALGYNIYWSTAYTQIWGDGSAGTFPGTASMTVLGGQSAQATGTMYGRLPAGEDVPPGTYADMITVTVTY